MTTRNSSSGFRKKGIPPHLLSDCSSDVAWAKIPSSNIIAATPRMRSPYPDWPKCVRPAGRLKRTSKRPKANAVWTSTKHEVGQVGIITPSSRFWHCCTWCCNRSGWGKKEPAITVREVRRLIRPRLALRRFTDEVTLYWSEWRRHRNQVAKASHEKRRREELQKRSKKTKAAL